MGDKLTKIRLLVYITLFIVLIESISACGLIFSGYMYREYDSENAEKMIENIKENNEEYYAQLTSAEDSIYLKEFYDFYEKKGHPLMIAGGFMLLALSGNIAIPLVIMLFITAGEKEIETEKTEKKEEKTV